jgi:hypothetical protein
MSMTVGGDEHLIEDFVPLELRELDDPQTAIPAIARDPQKMALVRAALHEFPTQHEIFRQDAREIVLPPSRFI